MRHGADRLADAGVDVIDINMGCPSKQVTGGQSGSALMRDLDLASQIIDAALEGAGARPVTLKMRLGWDHDTLNAAELAVRAERQGVRMITVHGRTRCMFYKGKADWSAIAKTVEAVDLQVIANGDIAGAETARQALAASGAHGVMVGRAALGQPWLVGEVDAALRREPFQPPALADQCDSLQAQVSDSVALYGDRLGVRTVRKHVSAAIDVVGLPLEAGIRRQLRATLCQIEEPAALIAAIGSVYDMEGERLLAASGDTLKFLSGRDIAA
ncbi:MAG: tRNA-dihydrouridine synthase [Pseudomonadota bacterium]